MTLVIDAGGTYLRYSYAKEGIELVHQVQTSDITLYELIELELAVAPGIKSVCISYAGQVKEGVILSSPNRHGDLGDIKNYFEHRYNIRLFIQNDLTCAVLAQAQIYKSKNLCAFYIGTGLGLGVISDGVLLKGIGNTASELGHIPYKKAPFRCGCGRDNCLELFVSGTALYQWKKHYNLDEKLSLKELKESTDLHAQEIYTEFIKAYLYALGTVITLFNPKELVLGGGVIESNTWLHSFAEQHLQEYSLHASLEECSLLLSQLENAPLKGALQLKDRNDK